MIWAGLEWGEAGVEGTVSVCEVRGKFKAKSGVRVLLLGSLRGCLLLRSLLV